MTNNRRAWANLSRDELTLWCKEQGAEGYRADQIRKWVFGKRVCEFSAMTDLPATLREAAQKEFDLFTTEIVQHKLASDRTEKLLLRLWDGEVVECVLMREEDRRTICISTQVGCGMGCVFCASGMLGLKRNLTSGEILEQVLRLDRLLDFEERITNVVVMGIGEPLANLNNLIPALDTLNEKGGFGIGARKITISTVGLPEKIRELARSGKQYNLAVSLHAPTNDLRNELVGINKKIGLDAVMEAAEEYFDITGRRVTYEYVMLGGINDAERHARELAKLLHGRNAHVNLIPMNAVGELEYSEPTQADKRRFVEILDQAGIPATIRKRKGADIDAACGQLRLQHQTPVATVTLL